MNISTCFYFSGQRLCSTPAVTSRRPANFPVRRLNERNARKGDCHPNAGMTTGVTVSAERKLARETARKLIGKSSDATEVTEEPRVGDKKNVDKSAALLGALESWDRKNDSARQKADVAGES